MSEEPQVVAWDEAYNAVDMAMIVLDGLIHAACILADEHPALGGPERETAALHVVLTTLRERNEALRDLRSAEYRAGLALRKASADAD